MTHDDSVQIAVTPVSVGRRSIRDVVVSTDRQTPVAQNVGSASRPRRKFCALQSLEN